MLLEKIVEVRHLREAQRVRNLRDVPCAVPQHDFRLLQNTLANDLGRGFVGDGFYGAVQVVDVDVQLLGKIAGRAETHLRVAFVNRELPFEQFQKQGGDALRGVVRLFASSVRGLHFGGKMQQFEHQISQGIVLVDVLRSDFLKHFQENAPHTLDLLVGQFKHMVSGGLEYGILAYVPKFVKKMLVEDAVQAVLNPLQIAAGVRNLWCGEEQGLFLYGNHFVRVTHVNIADHEHDFVEIPPFIRCRPGLSRLDGLVLKHIEMPKFMLEVVRHPIKLSLVKFFDGFDFVHIREVADFKQQVLRATAWRIFSSKGFLRDKEAIFEGKGMEQAILRRTNFKVILTNFKQGQNERPRLRFPKAGTLILALFEIRKYHFEIRSAQDGLLHSFAFKYRLFVAQKAF